MDIDFHYHATYVAARFAGYSYDEAHVIGSAAQVIDENGYGIVPEIPVLKDGSDELSGYVFKPLPTFATPGSIGGMWANPVRGSDNKNDEYASIWSVFHFLPGNFDLPSSVPPKFRSDRWERRTWGHESPATKAFTWLCRPHSPMAIELVRNCRDLVNDPASQVNAAGAALHLIGVTMHVFADTFAHQDHSGVPAQEVNDVRGDTFFGYTPVASKLSKAFVPSIDDKDVTFELAKWQWNLFGNKEYPPRGPKVSYLGHGRVGHWPDHSALIYKYQPAWSAGYIIRKNPTIYYDAFLHLVLALLAIKNNQDYVPMELTETNVKALFKRTGAKVGGTSVELDKDKLDALFELIRTPRTAMPRVGTWGGAGQIDDVWDQAIAVHGETWRETMKTAIGLEKTTETWLPCQAPWILEAQRVLGKPKTIGKVNPVEARVVYALDYFKFNYAAKIHYRSVKERLLAWGQQLIGEWNDGSAYVDDLAALKSAREPWREKGRVVLGKCATKTEKQYRQQGIMLLLGELDVVKTEREFAARLHLALSDAGEAVYTLHHQDGGNTVDQIKKLLGEMGGGGDRTVALASLGAMPSLREFREEMTYERFARRASDRILVRVDEALEKFEGAKDKTEKLAAAKDVQRHCAEWLKPDYTDKTKSRTQGVNRLLLATSVWLRDNP
jgi:hypothetical protein